MTTGLVPRGSQLVLSRRTNADLSAGAYCFVIANGDDDMDICGANGEAIGVLTNDVVDATGLAGAEAFLSVVVQGCALVKFGGAVTAGKPVKSDGSGNAVLADTDKDKVLGYAWETAATSDIGLVLLNRSTLSV